MPEVVSIPLTRGLFTLVDAEDYECLPILREKWCVLRQPRSSGRVSLYAIRNGKVVNGKKGTMLRMHRVIVDAPAGMDVDHISRDTLDNRRSNLRVCEHFQNTRNRVKLNTSLYKGVHPHQKRWRARITVNGKTLHIGCFTDQAEAALAYDQKARDLFGEFALLNFPERT
jgi:hypothetical protein